MPITAAGASGLRPTLMSASSHDPQAASPIKDVMVPCLLLIVGALVIVCVRQHGELQRLTAASNRAPAPAEAHPRVRPAQAQTFVVAPLDRAPARAPTGHDEDVGEFTPTVPAFGAKPRPAADNPLARLLNNPDFFQALQLHRQATLDNRFAPLFRQLALGPDELAAFKRLLAEKENVALDVIAVSESQPDGPLPAPMLGASVNAARARVDDAIRTALGAERYAVYNDYEKSLPQRTVVAQLEQRLSYTPTPLTPVQAESLVKILTVHAPAAASAETAPTSAVVVANGTLAAAGIEVHAPTAVVSNDALAEAQALLAPHQINALREIQTEQQATAQAMQLLRANLPLSDKTNGIAWQLLLQ